MPIRSLESKGIRPLLSQGYVVPSTKELAELSALVDAPLPDEYAAFVSEYGCSVFKGLAGVRPAGGRELLPFAMFYGGGKPGHNVLARAEAYRGRMPDEALPIARDAFGNQFCLVASGPRRGHVYFWDHEQEPDPDDYAAEGLPLPNDLFYLNMTLAAESLSDFFARIEVRAE
jgi:hypothetical protein